MPSVDCDRCHHAGLRAHRSRDRKQGSRRLERWCGRCYNPARIITIVLKSLRGEQFTMLKLRLAIILSALSFAAPASAARCGGDFNTFIATISPEAPAAAISPGVISPALPAVPADA